MNNWKMRAALAGVSAVALTWGGTAAAQEGGDSGLQEIVVTAQKRSENLQDTPLAVSALTAETLESRRIADISDISAAAPNLTTTVTPSSTTNITVHIRGIGESDPVLTVDSPVGIYVDGVVIGRTAGAVFDLVDLERVEVLRGPQGTLYGRNTTGGAVNFITAKPADSFKASQTFSYGRYDYMQSRTSIDTGEVGNSGLRFKFSYLHKQRDGYADDVNQPNRRDPGASNVDAFRIAARFDQGGPLRIDYAFDYNDSKSYSVPFQLAAVRPDIVAYLANSPALGGSALNYSRDRLSTLQLDQGQLRDKVQGHTLTVEYDVTDDITLRSLTGYRKWDNVVDRTDLDGNDNLQGFTVSPAILAPPNDFIPQGINEVELFGASNVRSQKQFSQELNLLGKAGDNVEFVLGAFYFKEKARENNPQQLTLVLPSPATIPLGGELSTDSFGVNLTPQLAYRHTSESMAVFGQATFHATDKLSFTGGIRYTEDKKHLDQSAAMVRDLHAKFSQVNWAASVDYKFSNDILAYARVATGYKAGGFNPRSVGGSFDPEKIISYEAGLKTELLDRHLRFNLTGFHSRYKDLQVSQFLAGTGGASSITVNAGKATYTGVEAELLAEPVRGVTFNASVGYVDRKFQSFIIRDSATDELINVADEARFHYSASTTANAGIQYETPLSFGKFQARLDWTYRSRIYFHPLDRLNPFNRDISDGAVGRFDARVALSQIDMGPTRATVALWGKNITNEDYLYSGIDFGSLGFAGIVFAEPRTYGVDVKLEF
ncbi:TonB-dependent receptor [Croceicoccus estronivorus]|uniref:TonB-dependent receptor n=1 Tax=Croceicoccus estronivorus TaxID=1172626 RepID=UPI0008304BDF|nr:TonB-dependent receptor [Croceicoccus estronivorus]OCC24486.1 TonB-dependent receptor [Croceicoccus estronivorus]